MNQHFRMGGTHALTAINELLGESTQSDSSKPKAAPVAVTRPTVQVSPAERARLKAMDDAATASMMPAAPPAKWVFRKTDWLGENEPAQQATAPAAPAQQAPQPVVVDGLQDGLYITAYHQTGPIPAGASRSELFRWRFLGRWLFGASSQSKARTYLDKALAGHSGGRLRDEFVGTVRVVRFLRPMDDVAPVAAPARPVAERSVDPMMATLSASDARIALVDGVYKFRRVTRMGGQTEYFRRVQGGRIGVGYAALGSVPSPMNFVPMDVGTVCSTASLHCVSGLVIA